MNKKLIVSISGRILLLFFLSLSLFGFTAVAWSQEDDQSTGQIIENILLEVAEQLERRDFLSALQLFDTLPPEHAQITEIRILRASIYNAAGRPIDAKRIANEIITAESNNTYALMVLADAAVLENNDRERRVLLERVLSIDPNHARALNDLANISIRNQNLRAAAGYFDRVLAVEPGNGEALVGRASVYRYR